MKSPPLNPEPGPLPPLPGLDITPCHYPDKTGATLPGLALRITDPRAYRPAHAAQTILRALEHHIGPPLWNHPGTRPGFYAQLWGTPAPAPPWPSWTPAPLLY